FGVLGISLLGLPDAWIYSLLQGELPAVTVQTGMHWVDQLFQSGEWLMLLAAMSMAIGTVMVRYVCRYTDPVIATGWHMILGGLPLFALSAGLESHQWTYLQWSDWTALAYSTIFGSAIAYGLFFYFASSGNLTSFSALTFLTPIFALLFGNLFLAEVLSLVQWVGVSLTLISIYLINQRDILSQTFNLRRAANREIPVTWEETSGSTPSSPEIDRDITEISTVRLSMVEPESEVSP
ncbi:DMT family transporter, partial [Oculatella sp. LEGE 06141]|uniref:DMT family transporter n=1 Tax=Oculatella sp. LEGE 06141 TaxID=1828648 RepID=UPI0018818631